MNRALVVGASVLGILAVGWFGWNRLADDPAEPETSVVVDQTALSQESEGTAPAPAAEQETSDTQSAEAATSETAAETAQSEAEAQTETAGAAKPEEEAQPQSAQDNQGLDPAKTAEQVVAALMGPQEDVPQPSEEAEQSTEAEQNPQEDATATTLPRFDLVRVDADGQTIIAGKAAPGEKVEVLLDGKVIATAEADAAGAFVSVLTTPLSGEAQQLQLRTLAKGEPAAPQPASGTGTEQVAAAGEETTNAASGAATDTDRDEPASDRPETAQETARETTQQAGSQPEAEQPAAEVAQQEAEQAQPEEATQEEATQEVAASETAPSVETPAAQVLPQTTADASTPSQQSDNTVVARAEPQAATSTGQQQEIAEAEPSYALSAPVIILPSTTPDAAPALVQPLQDKVALLQPQGTATSVTLDAINYSELGAVELNGRGAPGNSVRIYGNGDRLGDTGIEDNGRWAWALARERALGIRLFRFDELDTSGLVASRIETPFTYEALSPKVVRQREVVIQRGDYLWSIAEQYYGEGIRYSLIYGANTELIRDPDLIYPGQVFSVPELVDAE
ncbi:MAG: LysM peptidoglycan-binding domain-containing protein [Pseudomonadota bacterium]